MDTYKVKIIETLSKTIEVQAEDAAAAIKEVKSLYNDGKIQVSYLDYSDTRFVLDNDQYIKDLLAQYDELID